MWSQKHSILKCVNSPTCCTRKTAVLDVLTQPHVVLEAEQSQIG